MEKCDRVGFGGSCHWCTEAIFQSVRGVEKVEQGWISPVDGGSFSEAVLVYFDPSMVTVSDLLEVHLYSHSCTSVHSMRGKYRSAVYVFDRPQFDKAKEAIGNLQASFEKPIITQVLYFGQFRLNSGEFLDYYKNNPERPFCRTYIGPKLRILLDRFADRMLPISP